MVQYHSSWCGGVSYRWCSVIAAGVVVSVTDGAASLQLVWCSFQMVQCHCSWCGVSYRWFSVIAAGAVSVTDGAVSLQMVSCQLQMVKCHCSWCGVSYRLCSIISACVVAVQVYLNTFAPTKDQTLLYNCCCEKILTQVAL